MTKVNIFSGFLGAGKTTLIKKLLAEVWKDEKVVLIENEFGEIGIDGGFLKEAGIEITEMNSGCICCSLVGDFGEALKKVLEQFHPDRILIEPSGVGKLSDVVLAVERASEELAITGRAAVVDAVKCKMYAKNFGEFYNDQIASATAVVLSRTQKLSAEKLAACEELLRTMNATAAIVTTPWDELDAQTLLNAIEPKQSLEELLMEQQRHAQEHADEDDEHDEDCECEACRAHRHEDGDEEHQHEHHHHHDHDDDDDEDEHEHHHHHDDDEDEHEHHHHHDDDDDDEDEEHEHHHHEHGHHHHHHHHHDGEHDADEIFSSWGQESARAYSEAELQSILTALDSGEYGVVLRAKGIVPASDGGQWLHFDYVPEEHELRRGAADYTGRLCVIGAELKEDALQALFSAPGEG